MGHKDKNKFLSKWSESCFEKVESEGFIALLQFPHCLCSSGPVEDAGVPPCILMKRGEMGHVLGHNAHTAGSDVPLNTTNQLPPIKEKW